MKLGVAASSGSSARAQDAQPSGKRSSGGAAGGRGPGRRAPVQFSSVQFSRLRLLATPRTAALQASLSITCSRSLLKLMSFESVMPSNHLNFCRPLLLSSIFPSICVFSNESTLRIRWPEYWSFSFSISPSNEYPGLISFRIGWFDFLAAQGTLKSLLNNTRVQKHQFFTAQLCL